MTTPLFAHDGSALRFGVLGDSLAAGVGCTRAEDSLGNRLTRRLRESGQAVGRR
jgi:hypothetical protein